MTVNATADFVRYQGANSVGPFPVPFRFMDATHLQVVKTLTAGDEITLALGTDYTVAGVDLQAGGSVTLTAALPANQKLTILPAIPIEQQTIYVPNDPFPAKVHERALDKLTMILRQLRASVSRTIQFPFAEMGSAALTLPKAVLRRGKMLGFSPADGSLTLVDTGSFKGDPGGNVLAVGSFAILSTLSIPVGSDRIQTSNGAAYIYDAAVNAAYVTANPRTAAITANGRGFRLDPGQVLYARYFGAVGDNATDNYDALMAALQFIPDATRDTSVPIYLELGRYYVSKTLEPRACFTLIGLGGRGNGAIVGFSATHIVTPQAVTAIRVNSAGTRGPTESGVAGLKSAAMSRIKGITFWQQAYAAAYVEDAHAIDLRAAARIEECSFVNVAGDCIHIDASTDGTSRFGEASNWSVIECFAHSCRGNGLYVRGADANIGLCVGLHTQQCGRCGIYDVAYYNNVYIQAHLNGYGITGVWHLGRNYQLIEQGGGAAEPGTQGAIAKWYPRDTAAAPSTRYPQWVSTNTYYPNCPLFSQNTITVIGTYIEGGATYAYAHAPRASVFGPDMGWTDFTPILQQQLGSLVGKHGVGQFRSTNGDSSHIAYPLMGDEEWTIIGAPDDRYSNNNVHKSLPLRHRAGIDDIYLRWTGVQDQDLEWSTGVSPVWSYGGNRTQRTHGRAAPIPNVMAIFDYALCDPTDSNNQRVFGLRTGVPTYGCYARGERYWNVNPSAGGTDYWVCTQSGVIAQKPWVTDYYLLGATVSSDGAAWAVTRRGAGQSLTAPTGAGPTYTDPTTGMVWARSTTPFVFVAKAL